MGEPNVRKRLGSAAGPPRLAKGMFAGSARRRTRLASRGVAIPCGIGDTYSPGQTTPSGTPGYLVRVRFYLPTRIVEAGGLLALSAVLNVAAVLDIHEHEDVYLSTAGSVLLVASCLTLVIRHRWPRTVLAASCVYAAAYLLLSQPGYFIIWPLALALYSVITQGRLVFGGVVAALVTGGVFAISSPRLLDLDDEVDAIFWVTVLLGITVLLGELRRKRAAYLSEVEQRMRIAEQASEEAGRRHASEERLRIARELHDSLTHSLSVVNVQSGVAVHLLAQQPDRDESAYEALGAIKSASQEALRELRATLEALRAQEERPSPPPTLRRLGEVIEQTRAAGNPVEADVDGLPDHLPAEVTRTAFRIAQEALTNSVCHAPGARVRIRARADRTQLELSVIDDGAGRMAPPVVEGHGLIGMRERVNALKGQLGARPRADAGFEVVMRLPLGQPAAGPVGLERG